MTDKEKISAEVVRLKEEISIGLSAYEAGEENGKWELCEKILSFIDSLPEEPTTIDFEQELYKAFGQVKDFTLGMQIAKRFYNMGRNSKDSRCRTCATKLCCFCSYNKRNNYGNN